MSHYRFGVLSVRIRYTFPHHGAIYYQRAVPTDLRDRYKSPNVKHKLTSTDPVKVKREVERLNARYEAEWGMLRADPSMSPAALKTHAEALLREWGLSPKDRGEENDPLVLELLNDKLDTRRLLHVERHYENPEDSTVHSNVPASEYLTPVEIEALRLLHHKPKPTANSGPSWTRIPAQPGQ